MAHPPISNRSSKTRRGALISRKKVRTRKEIGKHRPSTKDIGSLGPSKPSLTMLLAEPEIQLLMRADRIDVHKLMAELNAISTQLQKNTSSAKPASDLRQPPQRQTSSKDANYRPGVGIMLLSRQGQVFVARRIDVNSDAWQMPQGGINPGETPRRAALRELREEIGTDNVEIVAESKGWFYYDVPAGMAQKTWAGKWLGQRQKWFVMIFKGRDADINLATEHPEFDAWRWASVQELSALAVSFKRQLYVDIMGEFATIFRD
jgi:putative (di)nucleoside polyphosphate hydrolase